MNAASLAEFSHVFPWFFPLAAFLIGACIGSFLNVVIYRVPKGESIVRPGSHCACGQPIRWHDNIPILSWMLLRGKARCCGRAFSIRYPAVELLTAVLFLLCWLRYAPAVAFCGWVLISMLIAATFIDFDHMIIPETFTVGLGVIGVVLAGLVPALHGQHSDYFMVDSMRAIATSLKGMFIGSGLVLWIAVVAEELLKKEAMGFADVKIVGAIGAFCGWEGAVFTLFGGALVGTVWFAISLAWEKITGKSAPIAPPSETPEGEPAPLGLGAHVPFGPMLAIAGASYFLFFRDLMQAWVGELALLF